MLAWPWLALDCDGHSLRPAFCSSSKYIWRDLCDIIKNATSAYFNPFDCWSKCQHAEDWLMFSNWFVIVESFLWPTMRTRSPLSYSTAYILSLGMQKCVLVWQIATNWGLCIPTWVSLWKWVPDACFVCIKLATGFAWWSSPCRSLGPFSPHLDTSNVWMSCQFLDWLGRHCVVLATWHKHRQICWLL